MKLDDKVFVYGYARKVGNKYSIGFFNGVEMQIIDITTDAGCTSVTGRFFDLNEQEISDWDFHINQARKVK